MPVLAARRDTNAQIELVNQQYLQEGPYWLLTGSILGALGFFIAVVPYILRVLDKKYNFETLESDEIPDTVSSLVSKWETPEARIFFGFELSAAFCIMMSWYPYKLRNACCISATGGCRLRICCCSIHWATFRQFVPPVGLILLTCCPTVNVKQASPADIVLVFVHCVAAMMMFVGFLMAEGHSLSIRFYFPTCGLNGQYFSYVTPLKCHLPTVDYGTPHYKLRNMTWNISASGFIMFLVFQGILQTTFWKITGDTSKWMWNLSSFVCEVVAGLAMLGNHAAIWYYTPERHWSSRGIVGDWTQATVHPVAHGELSFAASQQALNVELATTGSVCGGKQYEAEGDAR